MAYLRVRDVSKIIDRDRATILRWEREGKTPHVRKDSRGWRIYTEQDIQVILNFLKKNNPHYNVNVSPDGKMHNPAG